MEPSTISPLLLFIYELPVLGTFLPSPCVSALPTGVACSVLPPPSASSLAEFSRIQLSYIQGYRGVRA